MSLFALLLFLSMGALLGTPVSYDDDTPRTYKDDDAEAERGCHHKPGTEPCTAATVYLNGVPFTIALVMAIAGCCVRKLCSPKQACSRKVCTTAPIDSSSSASVGRPTGPDILRTWQEPERMK